nr:MAG TPA: hypothetical protein [Caudoviricetes sp.]
MGIKEKLHPIWMQLLLYALPTSSSSDTPYL